MITAGGGGGGLPSPNGGDALPIQSSPMNTNFIYSIIEKLDAVKYLLWKSQVQPVIHGVIAFITSFRNYKFWSVLRHSLIEMLVASLRPIAPGSNMINCCSHCFNILFLL